MQTEKGASLVQIKALNRRQLRRAIYRQGPVARNRLARELGVPLSEVTKAGGRSKIIVGVNKDAL